jgi:hypothetical protein
MSLNPGTKLGPYEILASLCFSCSCVGGSWSVGHKDKTKVRIEPFSNSAATFSSRPLSSSPRALPDRWKIAYPA